MVRGEVWYTFTMFSVKTHTSLQMDLTKILK